MDLIVDKTTGEVLEEGNSYEDLKYKLRDALFRDPYMILHWKDYGIFNLEDGCEYDRLTHKKIPPKELF